MEKTNSNIPTPEELKAYIDESVISVTGTYEQSASVLMVDDSIIGTLGNFSASIGKAKSKKTFNVSAIAAAALNRDSGEFQCVHRESQKQEDLQRLGHCCGCSDKWHGAALPCLLPGGQKEDSLY